MTTGAPAVSAVSELARALGDPEQPGHPFSAAALAALDEAAALPEEALALLDEVGLPRFYVPVRHGGALDGFPELLDLLRVVAGRDLSVAIAHGKTFLGAVSVWVGGTPEQAASLGARVLAGARVAWGLTERGHGSDLLAGELTAVEAPGGWRLDGEKWLVNNATRGDLVCVLARTAPGGGARGFSLFLVDKAALAPGSHRTLDKVRTHGIRGADISGIAFDGAVVPAAALVGGLGDGVEIVLKSLQLTRTLCAALSTGAADHGLRLTADFLAGRELYGRRLGELPWPRRMLGEAVAAAVVADAVATTAARAVHALPAEMSVISAVCKALVPTLVQESLSTQAELLGARGFLTGDHADGRFAKLDRDHRIVGIFDGSTAVNRNALITQFPGLARGARTGWRDLPGVLAASGADGLGPLAPERLELVAASGCSVVRSLPDAVDRLVARPDVPARLLALTDRFAAEVDRVHRDIAACRPSARAVPDTAFDLAERYELCFAGTACLWSWLRAGDADPGRLVAALHLVLTKLGLPLADGCDAEYDELAGHVLAGRPTPSLRGSRG